MLRSDSKRLAAIIAGTLMIVPAQLLGDEEQATPEDAFASRVAEVEPLLRQLAAKDQPEGENGWPALERAVDHIYQIMEEEGTDMLPAYPLDNRRGDSYVAYVAEAWQRTIQRIRNSSALDDLNAFRSATRWVAGSAGEDDPSEYLRSVLSVSSRIESVTDARWYPLVHHLADKDQGIDIPETVELINETLLMAQALSHQPILNSNNTADNLFRSVYSVVDSFVELDAFDTVSMRKLIDILDQRRPAFPKHLGIASKALRRAQFLDAFDGQSRLSHDVAEELREQYRRSWIEPRAALHFKPIRSSQPYPDYESILDRIDELDIPDWSQVTAMLDSVFDQVIDELDQPHWIRQLDKPFLPNVPSVLFDEFINLHAFLLLDYATTLARTSTFLEGTRIKLAIEIYKREVGRYPPSLECLVPDYLVALPFDPFNGRVIGYRTIDEGDDRVGYVLYSFGGNARDNGGVPCRYTSEAWEVGREDIECDVILYKRRSATDAAD